MKTEFPLKKKIPTGVNNFHKLIRGNYLFCDKTLMLKEYLDKGEEVTLIVRPRRWGKTLNMSMFHHFFANEVYGNKTNELFLDLNIARVENGKYLEHQGKYPVIFVSFKDIKESSFEEALKKLKILIRILYREHRYLLLTNQLELDEKELFTDYLRGNLGKAELEDSIRYLSELLAKVHGKKVYIIIDEYDTPLNNSYEKYLEDMTRFMRNLFSAALKGNEALERGILTGILRVSKDSMLSGLNNLTTYTLLDAPYKHHFGFSEAEVTNLFVESGHLLNLKEVKKWYNGYKVYDLIAYNPWSIVACLSNEGQIDLYWTESARNDLVKSTIVGSTSDVKSQLEILMQEGTISRRINKQVTFDMLTDNETALWSLLLFTGYLTAESSSLDRSTGGHVCELRIPNLEVLTLYHQYVLEWFTNKLGGGERKYKSFLDSLEQGNVKEFVNKMEDYLLETASIFDVGGDKKGESFYHGFSLALIASLQEKYYIRSNRESGLGRYDTLLIPKEKGNEQGIILEFKHAKKDQKIMLIAEEALKQINDKLYETEFKSNKNIRRILKIGIAFSKKSVASAHELITLSQ